MHKPTKRPYDRTSFVLIVDDDDTLLKFFKIHLNKFFSRVIVVRNAKEAVETLKEKEIDLVITDIRMPRTDGFQLLRKIREFDASIPVVLVTGALLDEQQNKEAHEYADGFLRKPFSIDELHGAIDSGFTKRDVLKKLATIVANNKNLLKVVSGKLKVEDVVPEENQTEATELYKTLKAG
jgi:DNA-binding response OmpR family regulator